MSSAEAPSFLFHLFDTDLFCTTGDVCNFTLGLGSIKGTTSAGPARFTVEVICLLCDSLYRPCSDCEFSISPSSFKANFADLHSCCSGGGGGGRLTLAQLFVPLPFRRRQLTLPLLSPAGLVDGVAKNSLQPTARLVYFLIHAHLLLANSPCTSFFSVVDVVYN